MKYYEFIDNAPKIGRVMVIEGTERTLAESALDAIIERTLTPDVRALNLDRFGPDDVADLSRVRETLSAMPFLASSRVTVITDAHTLKAPLRQDLLAIAQEVPEGNVLVIVDLVAPRSQRPKPIGAELGKVATRIDTTANEDVRERFVQETLKKLNATAEPRVIAELVRSESDLASVRNDLEKLALSGTKITFAELERESLSIEDPKAYKYASALLEGRVSEAFAIAADLFDADPRGAAIPLLSALANECGYVWEMARPGGALPARLQWRERALRPLAGRIGARRARAAFERAVRGIEAIVTGAAGNEPGDHRALVERISAELSALRRR